MGSTRAMSRPTILYVEDEESDADILVHAMMRTDFPAVVRLAKDGREAMEYLQRAAEPGNQKRNPLPTLVLLDLRLSAASGWDVLSWIRSFPPLKSLPVLIYSGTGLEQDRKRAQEMGANGYLCKPLGFPEVMALTDKIEEWVRKVEVHGPAKEGSAH